MSAPDDEKSPKHRRPPAPKVLPHEAREDQTKGAEGPGDRDIPAGTRGEQGRGARRGDAG
jgi:hypothetical protein